MLNKQIAGELGTAEKTVKVHRGRVMQKLGVTSVAELVRLVQNARLAPVRNSKTKRPIGKLRSALLACYPAKQGSG
jgi:Bacterial regulatory proteins, luxR family